MGPPSYMHNVVMRRIPVIVHEYFVTYFVLFVYDCANAIYGMILKHVEEW
jgi:hypothetical protein